MLHGLTSVLRLPFEKNGNKKGFTLIEILIVVALLVGLMALLIQNFSASTETAKEDQTRIAMSQLSQALQLYRVHNNRYPTTEQGLRALVEKPADGVVRWSGPYTEEAKLKDMWGNDFEYTSDGRTFQIKSAGREGGAELVFPERTTDEQK